MRSDRFLSRGLLQNDKTEMKITVNGKERTFDANIPASQLIEKLGVDIRTVAIALNGEIVPKPTLANVTVKDGDSIEIVRIVGGGA